ncbi:MAG: BCCT family transporter [Oscillospiraceae bacterium]|nr:BCCT family transporter [Oscillospiraceae bacterium]
MIRKKFNLSILLIPLLVLVGLGAILLIFPDQSAGFIDGGLKAFIDNFSWYYLLIGFLFVAILVVLAFSKYGKIKLGDTDKPKYPTIVWAAMIYTTTMAADLIYFAFSEWMNYYSLADTLHGDAVDLALTYPLFHFGPTPWAFYILPAVAYAYWMYTKGKNVNKMSDAMMIKNKKIVGAIDLFTMISVLIAASVTLTISIALTPVCFSELFGIEMSHGVSIAVLLGIAIIYTIAIFMKRGIENMVKINVVLYALLIAVFLFSPNILFIIEGAVTGIGSLFNNFIPMSLNVDPARELGGFVQDFTVFYWAYWIAWAVIVPVFLGKISEGRTIRGMIIGGMSAGVLGGFTSFFVLGNSGLANQLNGSFDFIGMMNEGADVGYLIIEVFRTFPVFMPLAIMLLVGITMMMFNATTLDVMILLTSEASYRNEEDSLNPSKKMKIFWCLMFFILPVVFILNENRLASLQTVLILFGLPMSMLLIRVIYVFIKSLVKEH